MGMNFLKDLTEKSWIDWVKILVAIDIASVGIGLIIDIKFPVLHDIFGIISRIAFGVMYVFVSMLILKRVFPSTESGREKAKREEETIDADIKKSVRQSRRVTRKLIENTKKLFKKIEKYSDHVIDIIDHFLDNVEYFFKKRKKEVKKEIDDLLDK